MLRVAISIMRASMMNIQHHALEERRRSMKLTRLRHNLFRFAGRFARPITTKHKHNRTSHTRRLRTKNIKQTRQACWHKHNKTVRDEGNAQGRAEVEEFSVPVHLCSLAAHRTNQNHPNTVDRSYHRAGTTATKNHPNKQTNPVRLAHTVHTNHPRTHVQPRKTLI